MNMVLKVSVSTLDGGIIEIDRVSHVNVEVGGGLYTVMSDDAGNLRITSTYTLNLRLGPYSHEIRLYEDGAGQ